MPPFSVRIDPFLWLFDGKLGFELEVGVLSFLSVELVPVFIVNEQPPTFNYFVGREDPLSRESNGWGPLAGTSLGLGFWLGKKPLEGSVVRVIFTNYSYHYTSSDAQGEFDHVDQVERRLFGYFGSHSKYGAFTLAGGIGLGVELNQQTRCIRNDPPDYPGATQNCPDDDELLIKTDRFMRYPPVDLNGGLGGVWFMGRISLGVAFN
jgi:hypothetical protein